jgi:hypothetical protein
MCRIKQNFCILEALNCYNMPVRMVDDEPGGNSSKNNINRRSNGNSGGFSSGNSGLSGVLVNLLWAALPYLIRKPKLLLLVAALGLLYYLFFRS